MLNSHPANLLLRLFLEITGMVAIAQWGWNQADGWLRYLYAFGIPIVIGLVWAVFSTPGEPGRNNQAVVSVSGKIRLVIEIVVFTMAVIAMLANGQVYLAGAYVFALLLQSLWSAERIVWLSRN